MASFELSEHAIARLEGELRAQEKKRELPRAIQSLRVAGIPLANTDVTYLKANTLSEGLQVVRNGLAAKTEGREYTFAETSAELAKFTAQLHELSQAAEIQRVKLVALTALAEVLRNQIEGYENEIKGLRARLEAQTANAEAADRQLSEERVKCEQQGTRIAEIEHQLVVQTTEAEILGRRVPELWARLDEHERMAAERDFAVEQACSQATAAQQIEADLRAELAKRETLHDATVMTLRAEKTLTEEHLRQAQLERDRLLDEVAEVKREAEAVWASERMESAVMRERINDVAAEVARLTALLEGPGSTIDVILAGEAGPARGPKGMAAGEIAANGRPQKGSLTDRLRALQSRISTTASEPRSPRRSMT